MHALKHWIVQSSGLRAWGDDEIRLMEALKREGIPMYNIGCIPFTNEITGCEDLPLEPGFIHGSTKLIKILSTNVPSFEVFPHMPPKQAAITLDVLKASLFYDPEKFDQNYYRRLPKFISEKVLLNWDMNTMPIRKIMHEELPYDVFIKPTSDLKLFKGGVFEAGYTLYQQVCNGGMVDSSFIDAKDEIVMIAQVKKISHEYRFFVVNGTVVTGSQYMKDGEVQYDANVPWQALAKAEEYSRLYSPALAYTIDLGLDEENKYKIVEYNCINASGLYHADIPKLARVLANLST